MRAQSNITLREFLQSAAILGLSTGTAALLEGCGIFPAPTPTPKKIPQLGFLAAYNPPSATNPPRESERAFMQSLRELGWIEGQTIELQRRFAEFKDERHPDLAAELVRLKVEIIFPTTTTAAIAAKQATSVIPIVVPTMLDPVGSGLVTSLAHPGGKRRD